MYTLYRLLPMLLLCACAPERAYFEPATGSTYFTISIAETQLELQLALTEGERRKGLMYRNQLDEDHGMLFLFEKPEKRSFWMRNTHIPLDIAYLDAKGTLLEIHPLYPYNENPVLSYSEEVLIAIEVNQGWFLSENIQPGMQLDMESLKTAIIRRGYSISDYSL